MKNHLWITPGFQALILVVVGFLAYAGTLQAPFLASEVQNLLEDPLIQDFSRVNDIVRIDQIFNGSLPKLSYSINYLLGHRTPWGYHLVNLMIHLGVGLAFYWVVREWLLLLGSRQDPDTRQWLPFVAAAIHLVHPLNTQAVILASSRPLLFGSLFYLLTFGFLIRFLREFKDNPKKAKGSVDLLFMMACFAMGGTCDPVMVTLPFMGWIYYRFYIKSAKVEMEVFALALIPWIIYLIYQFTTPAAELLSEASNPRGSIAALYFLTQIKAFVFYYLPKILLPFHLNLDPDFRLVTGFTDWTFWVALLALAGLFAGVRAARSPLVLWASLWTFIIFMSFYGLGLDDPVVSEPRFYLPGMGIHLLLAMALTELAHRHPVAGWLRMGIPALFLILTFARGQDYRSQVTLWQATASSSPHKARVHYELGHAYLQTGATDPAEMALATTLRINPKHIPALITLGEIHILRKEYAQALGSYQALIDQGIKNPVVHFNTGLALLAMKQPKKAVPLLEEAVGKQPGSAFWNLTLARAYHQSRRLKDALKHYRVSLQINPDQPVVHNEMGMVFWDLKSFFFADASFQKANQLDPQYVEALNNLVSSSMLFKQYDQAIAYLNRLLEINPEDINAREMMIAALRFQKQQPLKPEPTPGSIH